MEISKSADASSSIDESSSSSSSSSDGDGDPEHVANSPTSNRNLFNTWGATSDSRRAIQQPNITGMANDSADDNDTATETTETTVEGPLRKLLTAKTRSQLDGTNSL